MWDKIKLFIYTYYWKIRVDLLRNSKLKNIIIFESIPDVSDNAKAVFDEMICRKMNNKYKMVWSLREPPLPPFPKKKNVYYLTAWSYQCQYYEQKAKVKICCNRWLEKNDDQQVCIYLSHGTPLKAVREYYTVPRHIDYCIAQSNRIVELYSHELNCDKDRVFALGFPRNDVFSKNKINIYMMFESNYKKIIVWYPTFRIHKIGFATASKNALPIIHNAKSAKVLNDVAKQENILIVLKPHFAQNLDYIKDLHLSNIQFIDDGFFVAHGISSYAFVGACDALITDYSSIYYDYTLCNKPIAAVWEDIEEYKQAPGLVEGYEYLMKGAEKVYTLEDFVGFIQRIGKGVDLLKTEREEIRDYVNFSTDGNNSKRVVDFIIEKANL